MKLNYKLPLSVIASFAIILPMSAFAKDQKQDGKERGKTEMRGQRHGGKSGQQGVARVSPQSSGRSHRGNVNNAGGVSNTPGRQRSVSRASNQSATVRQSNLAAAASQRSQSSLSAPSGGRVRGDNVRNAAGINNRASNQSARMQQSNLAATSQRSQSSSQRNQTQIISNQQTYTRNNNYGGLWFSGDTHRDWNRNGQHYWNHHNYRWYENGWLIIDGGYTPVYSDSGSTVSNVQSKLADQGYYNGDIDGDIGPGTRSAIADYQNDHNLRVTGRINDSLLQSLQLE